MKGARQTHRPGSTATLLRVGVDAIDVARDKGGTFQYAARFIRSLADAKCVGELTVFCGDEDIVDALGDAKVVVVRVTRDSSSRLAPVARWLLSTLTRGRLQGSWAVGPYAAIAQRRLDVVIDLGQEIGGFLCGRPYLAVIHEDPRRWDKAMRSVASRRWLRWRDVVVSSTARRAKVVIVHSEETYDALRRRGIPRDKLRLLPLQASAAIYQAPPPSELANVRLKYNLPERYLLYPAGFAAPKSHVTILDAVAQLLREHGILFHVVFTGPAGPTLKLVLARARALGVDHIVHYLGYVPDSEMPALLHMAAVVTSMWLGGPVNLPVIEGLAAGRPVICARGGPFESLVGDAGVAVDPRSPSNLAAVLLRIDRDRFYFEALEMAAARRATQMSVTEGTAVVCDAIADVAMRYDPRPVRSR